MGRNVTHQLIEAHLVEDKIALGEEIALRIDQTLTQDATGTMVMLMPILIKVSQASRTPASSVPMPMGFATILGGMTTTIGTSTNLLVVSVAADMGLPRLQMFDFLAPAAAEASIAIAYLWLAAPKLIPPREPLLADASPPVFKAHLAVPESSKAVGLKLFEAVKLTAGAMKVSSIERGAGTFSEPTCAS